MDKVFLSRLICPETGSKLVFKDGALVNAEGKKYPVLDGIPSLLVITDAEKNALAMNSYKKLAKDYDTHHALNFATFYQKEEDVRNSMIDRLRLKPDMKVLELNAGTGRDSVLIGKRLSRKGELHVQDISIDMLNVLKDKFKSSKIPLFMTQSNSMKLPYKDRQFDALYSFSGVAMSRYDGRGFFKEVARVVKPGGRVVLGGHGIAPWLRDTFFSKVLINQNETYKSEFDLKAIPVEARDVSITWILSGAGFVIDFTMGEGEPEADFDFKIPGGRGGTLRTRYCGHLEGVTPETKKLALKAREKLGISMHDWLDALIRKEAQQILKRKPGGNK